MQIPTCDQCLQLMDETGMPDHIRQHSLLVYRVAACLTRGLKEHGVALNAGLIHAAALLHDITKARSLETNELHSLTGELFLSKRGYPEIGSIVRQHVRLDEYDFSTPPEPPEIVNYADKRVVHDKVVSLEERMAYLIETYGTTPESEKRVREMWVKTERLEGKIFRHLPFSPGEMGLLLDDV